MPSSKDVDFFALVCVAPMKSVDFFASNSRALAVVPGCVPRTPKARNVVFFAHLIGTLRPNGLEWSPYRSIKLRYRGSPSVRPGNEFFSQFRSRM